MRYLSLSVLIWACSSTLVLSKAHPRPRCEPTPTNDNHQKSHEAQMKKAAQYFCDLYAPHSQATKSQEFHGILNHTIIAAKPTFDEPNNYSGPDAYDDVYQFTISAIPQLGCKPTLYNLWKPTKGKKKYKDFFHEAWDLCKCDPFAIEGGLPE